MARKTRSLGDGRNAEPGPLRRATRGRRRPIFSEPSVLPKEKARDSSCPLATARPWPCISRKSRCGRAGSTCAILSRSGRMACLEEAAGARQHYSRSIAAKVTRVEPSRKYLAVHARQLALKPGFQILRRHPRSLLFRLEQAYRHALENYVYRNSRMGLSVLIKETWY